MTQTLTQEEFQQEVCNNFPDWKWTILPFRAVGTKESQGNVHRMEWRYSSEGWDYTREGNATLLVKGEGKSMDEALDSQSTVACSFEAKVNGPD